jgi:hypothetical protein
VKTSLPRSKHPRTIMPGVVFALTLAIVVAVGLLLIFYPRSSALETTGTIGQCPARLQDNYSRYNFDQCVSACISCEKGTVVTCSTSCRLKGAN